tara:strand:+ start:3052 stop:4128 length:1077 start_codon:yes stop_codon:yes gene_type:complete
MNSNKKKIAFLVSRELTKRDINRFYLNEIVKKYDVNIQFYIIKNINESIKKKYNSEFQSKVIRGESDLKVNLIKYNADELILVFPFTKKTLWVHKTISYLNINYSYLALANNPLSNRSILYNLFFKIKSIGFKSANKIYFSGSSNINLLSMYLIGLRTKVIKTGSYDYNLYLKIKNKKKNISNNYFIFFDQYLENHPDFKNPLIKSPKVYWENLKVIFNNIEEITGCSPLIFPHPKRLDNNYIPKDIKVHKFNDLEIIKNSRFVLMHASTSVSFPVLFNIPIIQIYPDISSNSKWYSDWILLLSKILNTNLIYESKGVNIKNQSNKYFSKIDSLKYKKYIKNFIYDGNLNPYFYKYLF